MVETVISDMPEFVDEEIEQLLIGLSKDEVGNVRISLAKMLVRVRDSRGHFGWWDEVVRNLIVGVDHSLFAIVKQLVDGDE